jgi:predicted enzyme related to lactoylglutathione lyase
MTATVQSLFRRLRTVAKVIGLMPTHRNAVGWFEIYVQDMARARAFYEKTLQVNLEQLPAPDPNLELWAFPMDMEAPGCPGALVKMEGKSSGGGGVIIYFSCADCAVEAERAAANGGKLDRPKFSIGDYGFIAFVTDTEGNMIGLHSIK